MLDDAIAVSAPDEQLVALARLGDRAAREELCRRHWGVAQRVARRHLGDEQDALDAVQDGFLKAIVHLDSFDGRSGFRTWLVRIVTNAALDLGRKRKRRPSVPLVGPGEGRGGAPEPSVDDDPTLGLRRADLRRALDAGLARLKPAIRATFVMHAEAGMSYQEVADALGIPIGTVMSRLHFARRKLQEHLSGVEGL